MAALSLHIPYSAPPRWLAHAVAPLPHSGGGRRLLRNWDFKSPKRVENQTGGKPTDRSNLPTDRSSA